MPSCGACGIAVDLLAVHAAVLDEEAGRAVLELDGVVFFFLAAVGAGFRRGHVGINVIPLGDLQALPSPK